MTSTVAARVARFRALHAARHLRDRQRLGCGQRPHARRPGLPRDRDLERRHGEHARAPGRRRHARGGDRARHARLPRRSTSRSPPTSRTASATRPRTRPRPSGAPRRAGLAGGSIEDYSGKAHLRRSPTRSNASQAAVEGRARGTRTASSSPRVPRTSSAAARTSTTRSAACRPTSAPAPTCSSPRACPISPR